MSFFPRYPMLMSLSHRESIREKSSLAIVNNQWLCKIGRVEALVKPFVTALVGVLVGVLVDWMIRGLLGCWI
jgi:hypothetical protein